MSRQRSPAAASAAGRDGNRCCGDVMRKQASMGVHGRIRDAGQAGRKPLLWHACSCSVCGYAWHTCSYACRHQSRPRAGCGSTVGSICGEGGRQESNGSVRVAGWQAGGCQLTGRLHQYSRALWRFSFAGRGGGQAVLTGQHLPQCRSRLLSSAFGRRAA